MFKKVFAVLFVFALAFGAFAPVQAATPVSYESSIQVRNLTSEAGTISVTFFNQSGAVVGDPTVAPIKANETLSFYQSTMPVATSFIGSVVISSDVEIAAMSNLVGLDGAAVPVSYAAYSGFAEGAMEAYLPTLYKDNYGYNTFYYVQNTGHEATTVSVVYSDGGTKTLPAINPGQSAIVNQKSETHTDKVFSATLTAASAPIAVTVVEEGPTLFSYTGFGAGSETPLMPLINENNYGYFTGAQIMNTGDADTEVTVEYTPAGAGAACYETRTIEAGGSVTFAQNVFYNAPEAGVDTDCVHGATFVGSGMVVENSAAQPLVVVVNQLNTADVKGGAYVGFDPAEGGATIVYPLIMDRNYGYFTSHSIVNVGADDIAVGALTCTFTGTAKSGSVTKVITNDAIIAADGGSWTLNHDGLLADGFVGGATCTGPAGAMLVGTSNQLGATKGVDTLLVSEGFIVK